MPVASTPSRRPMRHPRTHRAPIPSSYPGYCGVVLEALEAQGTNGPPIFFFRSRTGCYRQIHLFYSLNFVSTGMGSGVPNNPSRRRPTPRVSRRVSPPPTHRPVPFHVFDGQCPGPKERPWQQPKSQGGPKAAPSPIPTGCRSFSTIA